MGVWTRCGVIAAGFAGLSCRAEKLHAAAGLTGLSCRATQSRFCGEYHYLSKGPLDNWADVGRVSEKAIFSAKHGVPRAARRESLRPPAGTAGLGGAAAQLQGPGSRPEVRICGLFFSARGAVTPVCGAGGGFLGDSPPPAASPAGPERPRRGLNPTQPRFRT